jgi:uncharacterized protein (TIGR03000 family)
MRNLLCLAAVTACLLMSSSAAEAGRRGGCGGGHGRGGCGGGGCGGGGHHGGGHCGGGYSGGGCGGGYSGGGCGGGVCYGGGYGGGGMMRAAADFGPATLIVELPADATLKIDGELTTPTSARRVFQTPAFEAAKQYSYEIEATVMVKGKPETVKQTVTIRGGEEKRISLELPSAAVAAR